MKRNYIIIIFLFIFGFLYIKSFNIPSDNNIVLGDSKIVIGDINSDGKVNSLDYVLIRKYILKQTTLSNIQKVAADMNSDSSINSMDYILIRKKILSGNSSNTATVTSTPKPTATPTAKPTAVPVSGISLNKTTLSMDGASSAQLTATISPTNAANKTVTWSSDNEKVAKVDANGKVSTNLSGTANITAKSNNGKTATCKVTVSVNITYKEVRYDQGDGLGTNIWYAIIPAKYKMHFAFANDVIKTADKTSNIAKKVNAVLAVNSHTLGFPYINGKRLEYDANVAGYDFIVKKNPNFKELDVNSPPWEALIVTGTKDYWQGITFKDINLGYSYDGDHLRYNGRNLYMALFHQIIKDGKSLDHYYPLDQNSAFWKKYYFELEKKHEERHPRTWLAYDSKGTQFVAVAMGRNYPLRDGTNKGQAGLTFHEIIKVTKKYFGNDIVTLYNLDGGGSSAFVYKGNKLNGDGDINSEGKRYERSVGGIFYW